MWCTSTCCKFELLTCSAVDTAVAIVAHTLVRAGCVNAVVRTNSVTKLQFTFVSICKKCTILIQDTVFYSLVKSIRDISISLCAEFRIFSFRCVTYQWSSLRRCSRCYTHSCTSQLRSHILVY